METMQPTLKNGRNVWDPVNMPRAEFEERVKKIRRAMNKEGIDVLLLYGDGFNEYGNSCYVSNYMIRLNRGALVVVEKKGAITLIFEGSSRGLPSAKATTWVEDVRAANDVSKECVKYLNEKKLIPSTVGFAGLRQWMPYHQLQFLLESFGSCKIVEADAVLKEMRMIKSQRECDQIRRSSRILTRAFDFISGGPFPDMNERRLEASLYREARLEGAEDFRMLIGKPLESGWAFRPADELPLSSGESIIVYLAMVFERYWCEGIRTFVVKDSSFVEPPREHLQTVYEDILDKMKPGKRASEFWKEAMEEIKKGKMEAIVDYGLGQGIGLSLREAPAIHEDEATPIQKGMCFSLRLAVREKEVGTFMIGNTLYVSKSGPEVLTRSSQGE